MTSMIIGGTGEAEAEVEGEVAARSASGIKEEIDLHNRSSSLKTSFSSNSSANYYHREVREGMRSQLGVALPKGISHLYSQHSILLTNLLPFGAPFSVQM